MLAILANSFTQVRACTLTTTIGSHNNNADDHPKFIALCVWFTASEEQSFENSFCRIERIVRHPDDPDEIPKV